MAFADPPYLGCCGLYDHFHPDGRCWDDLETHRLLIKRLQDEFRDGWALAGTSNSLRSILPLCPADARVAAWVKPFCAFKKGVRPCFAWEPLIFVGGRNPPRGFRHAPPEKNGKQTTPKDFLSCAITLKRGLTGAKPEAYCLWVVDLLNLASEDELVDLFPGTGAMSRALSPGELFVRSSPAPSEGEHQGREPR